MTAQPTWWTTPSPELAYVYGFAFADGVMSTGRRGQARNELILTQKDRTILDAIKEVAPGGRMSHSKGAKAWRLRFGAADGVRADVLAGWGLVPNKTEHGYWPRVLPEALVPHYIRGFFDGDGHISMGRRKTDGTGMAHLMFVCHLRPYLERLEEELRRRGASKRTVLMDGNNYRLHYHSQRDIPLIYDLLYNGATLYDERKRARFQEVAAHKRADHRPGGAAHPNAVFTAKQVVEMRRLYESGQATLPELAGRYGRSTSAVWGVLDYKTYKDVQP